MDTTTATQLQLSGKISDLVNDIDTAPLTDTEKKEAIAYAIKLLNELKENFQ